MSGMNMVLLAGHMPGQPGLLYVTALIEAHSPVKNRTPSHVLRNNGLCQCSTRRTCYYL